MPHKHFPQKTACAIAGAVLSVLSASAFIAATPLPQETEDELAEDTTEAYNPRECAEKQNPEGVRFVVDKVAVSTNYEYELAGEKAFSALLSNPICYMPQKHRDLKLVLTGETNGLLSAVTCAYNSHKPLVLSPDVIWLTICQGMAIHVNQHFKSLEQVLYKQGHPNIISIRNDKLGTDESAWAALVDSISVYTQRYTGNAFYDAFVPQFSTTTEVERQAYQVTLLFAQQKAYTYRGETGCGIPYITLKGTTADWKELKRKLSVLDSLGLQQWKSCLEPILDQFIAASEGRANRKFWKNIYKIKREYEIYSITGWIHQLFPYITAFSDDDEVKTSLSGIRKYEVSFHPNPYLEKGVTSTNNLTTDRFPCGIVEVPFEWKISNNEGVETRKMRFYAGFLGIKQYHDKSLEPFISWGISYDDTNGRINFDK